MGSNCIIERKIPFLDRKVEKESDRQDLLSAIDRVLKHGRILLGPEVRELEDRIAEYVKRKYAVGVNSGTDALYLAIKSLGIGQGDEVVTTSLSWIATANAIARTGATPVFADIHDDLNIAPDSIRKLITSRTKAIMPVHYTGKVCNMTDIKNIASKYGLSVIEDAAQAFGASYNEKKAGSFGEVSCFSMNPMKIFAACGDAGMVLTDNKDIYDRLLSLQYNGTVNKEVCLEPGLNARLDTLQAAILLRRLPNVENIIRKRREIASRYNELLSAIVGVPEESDSENDAYYTYTIKADNRDELMDFLAKKGVETKIQHPFLMYEQPAYRKKAGREHLNAGRLVKRILCIPANEKISFEEVDYVAGCIKEFYKGGR